MLTEPFCHWIPSPTHPVADMSRQSTESASKMSTRRLVCLLSVHGLAAVPAGQSARARGDRGGGMAAYTGRGSESRYWDWTEQTLNRLTVGRHGQLHCWEK